jgi:threonine dehydratase
MPLENLPFRLDVEAAHASIAPIIRRTPVLRVPDLEDAAGPGVFLKMENLQVTGSFKVRGAATRLLALSPEERAQGVVACSSGNHGRAVAYVAGLLDIPATICVPDWVDPVKLDGIRSAGAEVVLSGDTYDEAEERALALAEEIGRTFAQPFDDPWVAAGQGTLGLELLDDLPTVGTVVIPLSGGGLAGGVAYALKEHRPDVRVVAVSARNARVMYESVREGTPVSLPEEETLAEALSGGIGLANRYTLALIRELVDEHVLVDESEIREAMVFALSSLQTVVEGGGAVGLAAVLGGRCDFSVSDPGAPVAVVLSGGNVSLSRLATLTEA